MATAEKFERTEEVQALIPTRLRPGVSWGEAVIRDLTAAAGFALVPSHDLAALAMQPGQVP